MRQLNDIVLSGNDSVSINGSQLDTNQMLSMSFHLVSADSVTGTFKLQASNDIAPIQYTGSPTFVATNWVDIPNQSASVSSAKQAILVLGMTDTPFRWVRAVWTYASGGGTGQVVVNRFGQGI